MMFQKAIALVLLGVTAPALGQTSDVTDIAKTADTPAAEGAAAPVVGWTFGVAATAGANFTSNDSVVGQIDGVTTATGGKLDAHATWLAAHQEWRNTVVINEILTRTPLIDRRVKTTDDFVVESIYFHFLPSVPWFGGFARVAADTDLMKTEDVRPDDVTYVVAKQDGSTDEATANSYQLASGFEPLTTKESLGAVARPIKEKAVTVEARLGLGALQSKYAGTLVVADDAATEGTIELVELENSRQVGLETALTVGGTVVEDRITYKVAGETLTPYSRSPKPDGDDRSAQSLTRTEVAGTVGLNLTSWSALNFELKSKKEPLVSDKAQVTKTILLSVSAKWNG